MYVSTDYGASFTRVPIASGVGGLSISGDGRFVLYTIDGSGFPPTLGPLSLKSAPRLPLRVLPGPHSSIYYCICPALIMVRRWSEH